MKPASRQSHKKINAVTKYYKGEFLTEIFKILNINTDIIRGAETRRYDFKWGGPGLFKQVCVSIPSKGNSTLWIIRKPQIRNNILRILLSPLFLLPILTKNADPSGGKSHRIHELLRLFLQTTSPAVHMESYRIQPLGKHISMEKCSPCSPYNTKLTPPRLLHLCPCLQKVKLPVSSHHLNLEWIWKGDDFFFEVSL